MTTSDDIPIGLEPLQPAFPRPTLPGGRVSIRPTADEAYDALMADLLVHASGCVRAFGDFHLAIDGSPSVEPLLSRMMWDPMLREFPWKKTHVWLLAESGDGCARGNTLREFIVEPSDIPATQFHAVAPGPDADVAYESLLRECLEWREKGQDRLDMVIASLDAAGPLVRPAVPVDPGRLVAPASGALGSGVSLTLELVNASRLVAVVGIGSASRGALADLSKVFAAIAPQDRARVDGTHPFALRLRPVGGELRWYLDAEALGGGPSA